MNNVLQVRHFDKKKSYLMFKENLFSYQKTTCSSSLQSATRPGQLSKYEGEGVGREDGSERREEGGREGGRQTRTFKGSYRLVPFLTSAGN